MAYLFVLNVYALTGYGHLASGLIRKLLSEVPSEPVGDDGTHSTNHEKLRCMELHGRCATACV